MRTTLLVIIMVAVGFAGSWTLAHRGSASREGRSTPVRVKTAVIVTVPVGHASVAGFHPVGKIPALVVPAPAYVAPVSHVSAPVYHPAPAPAPAPVAAPAPKVTKPKWTVVVR